MPLFAMDELIGHAPLMMKDADINTQTTETLTMKPEIFMKRFKAVPNKKDNSWTIYDVDIFCELDRTFDVNGEPKTFHFTKEWLQSALKKAQARFQHDGYLPTLHLGHNKDGEPEAIPVGFFLPKEVRAGTYEGKEVFKIFSDWVVNAPAFAKIKNFQLPYRSIEVNDFESGEISSCALLKSQPPWVKNSPIVIDVTTEAKAGPSAFVQKSKHGFFFFSEAYAPLITQEQDFHESVNLWDLIDPKKLDFAGGRPPGSKDAVQRKRQKPSDIVRAGLAGDKKAMASKTFQRAIKIAAQVAGVNPGGLTAEQSQMAQNITNGSLSSSATPEERNFVKVLTGVAIRAEKSKIRRIFDVLVSAGLTVINPMNWIKLVGKSFVYARYVATGMQPHMKPEGVHLSINDLLYPFKKYVDSPDIAELIKNLQSNNVGHNGLVVMKKGLTRQALLTQVQSMNGVLNLLGSEKDLKWLGKKRREDIVYLARAVKANVKDDKWKAAINDAAKKGVEGAAKHFAGVMANKSSVSGIKKAKPVYDVMSSKSIKEAKSIFSDSVDDDICRIRPSKLDTPETNEAIARLKVECRKAKLFSINVHENNKEIDDIETKIVNLGRHSAKNRARQSEVDNEIVNLKSRKQQLIQENEDFIVELKSLRATINKIFKEIQAVRLLKSKASSLLKNWDQARADALAISKQIRGLLPEQMMSKFLGDPPEKVADWIMRNATDSSIASDAKRLRQLYFGISRRMARISSAMDGVETEESGLGVNVHGLLKSRKKINFDEASVAISEIVNLESDMRRLADDFADLIGRRAVALGDSEIDSLNKEMTKLIRRTQSVVQSRDVLEQEAFRDRVLRLFSGPSLNLLKYIKRPDILLKSFGREVAEKANIIGGLFRILGLKLARYGSRFSERNKGFNLIFSANPAIPAIQSFEDHLKSTTRNLVIEIKALKSEMAVMKRAGAQRGIKTRELRVKSIMSLLRKLHNDITTTEDLIKLAAANGFLERKAQIADLVVMIDKNPNDSVARGQLQRLQAEANAEFKYIGTVENLIKGLISVLGESINVLPFLSDYTKPIMDKLISIINVRAGFKKARSLWLSLKKLMNTKVFCEWLSDNKLRFQYEYKLYIASLGNKKLIFQSGAELRLLRELRIVIKENMKLNEQRIFEPKPWKSKFKASKKFIGTKCSGRFPPGSGDDPDSEPNPDCQRGDPSAFKAILGDKIGKLSENKQVDVSEKINKRLDIQTGLTLAKTTLSKIKQNFANSINPDDFDGMSEEEKTRKISAKLFQNKDFQEAVSIVRGLVDQDEKIAKELKDEYAIDRSDFTKIKKEQAVPAPNKPTSVTAASFLMTLMNDILKESGADFQFDKDDIPLITSRVTQVEGKDYEAADYDDYRSDLSDINSGEDEDEDGPSEAEMLKSLGFDQEDKDMEDLIDFAGNKCSGVTDPEERSKRGCPELGSGNKKQSAEPEQSSEQEKPGDSSGASDPEIEKPSPKAKGVLKGLGEKEIAALSDLAKKASDKNASQQEKEQAVTVFRQNLNLGGMTSERAEELMDISGVTRTGNDRRDTETAVLILNNIGPMKGYTNEQDKSIGPMKIKGPLAISNIISRAARKADGKQTSLGKIAAVAKSLSVDAVGRASAEILSSVVAVLQDASFIPMSFSGLGHLFGDIVPLFDETGMLGDFPTFNTHSFKDERKELLEKSYPRVDFFKFLRRNMGIRRGIDFAENTPPWPDELIRRIKINHELRKKGETKIKIMRNQRAIEEIVKELLKRFLQHRVVAAGNFTLDQIELLNSVPDKEPKRAV